MERYNPAWKILMYKDGSEDVNATNILKENLLIEDHFQSEDCLEELSQYPLPFENMEEIGLADALRLQIKWHNFASSIQTVHLPMARKLLNEFYEELDKYGKKQ